MMQLQSDLLSKPYCSINYFPHFVFHLLENPLKPLTNVHIGLNALVPGAYRHFNVEELGVMYKSLLREEDDEMYALLENEFMTHPNYDEIVHFLNYEIKFDCDINLFCYQSFQHLLNPLFQDCRFGDRCNHGHATDAFLSSMIGYITYRDDPNNRIFGYVHCLYNNVHKYNVLFLHLIDKTYDGFQYGSVLSCIENRFRHEVFPSIAQLIIPNYTERHNLAEDLDQFIITNFYEGEFDELTIPDENENNGNRL